MVEVTRQSPGYWFYDWGCHASPRPEGWCNHPEEVLPGCNDELIRDSLNISNLFSGLIECLLQHVTQV